MDLEPSTQPVSKSRSRPSRHGAKSHTSRRPPSPDSACEHDSEWTAGGLSCQEEMTSDLSEESGDSALSNNGLSRKSGPSMRRKSDSGILKGAAGQDSDVDSGIVAYGKPGQRIGSTSSADTDSSQESRRRIEFPSSLLKNELSKSRSSELLRIAKHSSLTESNGPIKGDHLALKECNRRPPTPLSVFPESNHCVRFDEQLQLSEQNIRRSCRKLFATLYAQRFSYPNRPNSCLPPSRSSTPGSVRLRSRTAPELELRRYSPISVDGRHSKSHGKSPVVGRREEGSPWSNKGLQKSTPDVNVVGKVSHSYLHQHQKSHRMDIIGNRPNHTMLTDNVLNNYKNNNQCTCVSRQASTSISSSQPPTCTCLSCNCAHQPSGSYGLFKSNSCSTLPYVLSHQSRPQLTQFPPRNSKKPVTETKSADAKLQKTSSCSSLLDKGLQVSKVPVYSDNMVHVYAHIASVVPEDIKTSSQGGRRAKALNKVKQASENVYDSIRPASACTISSRSGSIRMDDTRNEKVNVPAAEDPKDIENLRTVNNGSVSKLSCDSDARSTLSDIYSQVGEVGNASISSKQSLRDKYPNRTINQRPKSVGVVVPSPVYLKSALKKPTQSALQNVSEHPTVNSHFAEVEYAVVDKSKKNRFTSLPALNGCNGNGVNVDNEHPPVPPKKYLHKSDFSLYRSRSSSPKKSLKERMQTLTKNAKTALQKAFSTERIYRPEREERMEASGQKSLQRSRSFIKGITNSFRRKKRKPVNMQVEVVTQATSPGPEWGDSPFSPNSPIHVRGQLLQLNLDGSQVVELAKPPNKPYGFFVARGRVRNSKGVFVSRMRDEETKKQLEGLLDIGDEILEIDGLNVKDANIMEVNSLMANKNTLLLTVLPYICRKDA